MNVQSELPPDHTSQPNAAKSAASAPAVSRRGFLSRAAVLASASVAAPSVVRADEGVGDVLGKAKIGRAHV